MTESLADDEIRNRLGKLYGLVRSYLQTLARRMGISAKYDLQKHVEPLNVGFELIILAALKGTLPEERVKQFWVQDIAKLRTHADTDGFLSERHDTDAANVAIDAFTTLTLAGLASVDPLALSQWIKDEAEKSA
jgi:hypothetical protein